MTNNFIKPRIAKGLLGIWRGFEDFEHNISQTCLPGRNNHYRLLLEKHWQEIVFVNPCPSDEWKRKLTSLAVTQCIVKQKDSGKLVALAEHGKSALGEQGRIEPSGSKL
jgi:hypothetical protein